MRCRAATWAFLLSSVASCSSSSSDAPPANPTGAFVARFELPSSGAPDLLEVPFPSDLQRGSDGSIAITPGTNDAPRGLNRIIPNEKAAQYVGEALARTQAFGVYGGALFELTGGAPDPSALPRGRAGDCTGAGSVAYIVDVDTGRAIECQAG